MIHHRWMAPVMDPARWPPTMALIIRYHSHHHQPILISSLSTQDNHSKISIQSEDDDYNHDTKLYNEAWLNGAPDYGIHSIYN
jgi:hypothetical protein